MTSSKRPSNATYVSIGKKDPTNQIDYVLTSARWQTSIKSCQVQWGAGIRKFRHGKVIGGRGEDVKFDHGLLKLHWNLTLRREAKVAKKIDWACLKSDGDVSATYERRVQEDLAKIRGVEKYVAPDLGKLKVNWFLNNCTKRSF